MSPAQRPLPKPPMIPKPLSPQGYSQGPLPPASSAAEGAYQTRRQPSQLQPRSPGTWSRSVRQRPGSRLLWRCRRHRLYRRCRCHRLYRHCRCRNCQPPRATRRCCPCCLPGEVRQRKQLCLSRWRPRLRVAQIRSSCQGSCRARHSWSRLPRLCSLGRSRMPGPWTQPPGVQVAVEVAGLDPPPWEDR